MRRLDDEPNRDPAGAAVLGYARERGLREVSLTFARLAHMTAADTPQRRSQRRRRARRVAA